MNTQEAITTRRSVRGYTPEELTESELNTILNAAYSSPIAGAGYKTMHLTVIQNKDVLQKISSFYKADMLFGAPALIIVSGQKDFDDTALFANAGCIIENIQISAWDIGLGSVFNWAAGKILPKNEVLVMELGIPDDFKPLCGVVIGHPAKEVSKRELKAVLETNYIR